MEANLQSLKHYIYELEYAISTADYERAKNVARMIKNSVVNVENEINNVTDCATGVYYKHINTIEFLYKPVDVEDPYKGDYLEKFARTRTFDLTKSGAKEGHDRFWLDHSVLNANVFGLVPVPLIPEDSVAELLNMGWLKVDVDVLDFGQDALDMRNIYSFCEQSFDKYIALKEEQTNSTVVLRFAS